MLAVLVVGVVGGDGGCLGGGVDVVHANVGSISGVGVAGVVVGVVGTVVAPPHPAAPLPV